MLPTTLYTTESGSEPQQIFSNQSMPGRTYRIDWNQHRMIGMITGLDAAAQAAAKILMTERYTYPIYDGEYGVELNMLMNQPVAYVAAHLENTVTEALQADDRMDAVTNFVFTPTGSDTVKATFDVETVEGVIQEGIEINGG